MGLHKQESKLRGWMLGKHSWAQRVVAVTTGGRLFEDKGFDSL